MYVPGPFELWVIQVVGLIYNHLKGKYIKTWIREQEEYTDLWVHKNGTSDVIKKYKNLQTGDETLELSENLQKYTQSKRNAS